MFYAAINSYSSETSIGFTNTWEVLAFESKVDRDNYVANSNDLATRSIYRHEIGRYIDRPKPFTGEFWGVDTFNVECHPDYEEPPKGLIGEVGIQDKWDTDHNSIRLNK